jgi:hypothetical protein
LDKVIRDKFGTTDTSDHTPDYIEEAVNATQGPDDKAITPTFDPME